MLSMIFGLQVVQVNRLLGDGSSRDASGLEFLSQAMLSLWWVVLTKKRFRLNLLTHDIQDSINQVSPMQAPPASERMLEKQKDVKYANIIFHVSPLTDDNTPSAAYKCFILKHPHCFSNIVCSYWKSIACCKFMCFSLKVLVKKIIETFFVILITL